MVGQDVICQAKSGLGKTAVFVISTLHQLELEPVAGEAQVLVMCHTRELAFQIKNEYARFTKYMPNIKTAVFYGGVNIKEDEKVLQDKANYPTIIVGTPGRLNALVRDKILRVGNIKFFVLDECDKMLESLDMRRDIQEVMRATPKSKQVMMFSATLSNDSKAICRKFMQNPLEIYVDDEAQLSLHGLQQFAIELQENEKNKRLNDILDELEYNQTMIFVKSIARANQLGKLLQECNFPATIVHGGLSQETRIARYKEFKEFKHRICVATDVFGRGVDFEKINVAINYDMPVQSGNASEPGVNAVQSAADTYLHRVGRAGRFGTKGIAISFIVDEYDKSVLDQIRSRLAVEILPFPEGGKGIDLTGDGKN